MFGCWATAVAVKRISPEEIRCVFAIEVQFKRGFISEQRGVELVYRSGVATDFGQKKTASGGRSGLEQEQLGHSHFGGGEMRPLST